MSAVRAEFDTTLAALQKAIERWDAARNLPTDFRNTSARRDVLTYVLPTAAATKIQYHRDLAEKDFAAGDWPGVEVQLEPAIVELNAASERFVGIVSYWRQRVVYDQRIEAWRRTVRANGLANPFGPEIARRESRLDEKIVAGQFADAARNDLPELLGLFDRALVDARAGTANGVLVDDPLRRRPRKSCDLAADGSEPPMLDDDRGGPVVAPRVQMDRSKPTFSFYPPIAAALNIEGVVQVRVLVSATGCVVWAETASSSNVSVLDDAATDWAVNGAVFEPATLAGRPIPVRMMFNVRFKLR